MKFSFAICAALLCAAAPSFAEEQRHLGVHEHGHGHLNIAIEAKRVSFELEVPGADIVGFEHDPSNGEERAAVDEAKAMLAGALSLFKLPPAAGCSLDRVRVVASNHDSQKPAAAAPTATEDEHSEFHAEYDFGCRAPAKLATIEFAYFAAFPKTEELEVNVITPKGQSSYKVSREKPTLELMGII